MTPALRQVLFGGRFGSIASALFSRFSTPATADRKALINALITPLVNAGIWHKFDVFYVMAAADEQAAQRNWVADKYNLVPTNSPTFVADSHYVGNGTSSYLATGFDPTTAPAPKFVQNNAHMGLWSLTDLDDGGAESGDIGDISRARIGRTGGVAGGASARVNRSSGSTIAAAGCYPGHVLWSRAHSSGWEGYGQGVDVGGAAEASSTFLSAEFRVLTAGTTFGVNQLAAAHWGSSLTPAEVLILYTALQTYLTAVGAI